MVCDTVADKAYISCDWNVKDQLVVIDGATDTISVQIPGTHFGELLASPRRSKVYATDHWGPELAVFDTGTDSLIRTIFIGGSSLPMCYDSIDDRVYGVQFSVLGEVVAINAATNQPVGHIQVGRYPQDIVWHAPANRIYCGSVRDVTVIDPTADTVTKILPVSSSRLCSAPRLNKVYVCRPENVTVVDCRNDSATKTIPITTQEVWSMCYVSTASYDKLYIGGYGGVSIIDCRGDTLIRTYPFAWSRLVTGREGKRVYCWQPYSLCTFDAAGDTLVAEVPWDAAGGVDLLYVQSLNRVYCAERTRGCVLVADGATDTVITEIPLYEVSSLGYDSANGLVYCGHGLDSVIRFVDCRTDSVVGSLNTGLIGMTFVTVSAHNRVYVGGGGNSFIPVIRTDPPGVEETPNAEVRAPNANPTVVQGVLFLPEATSRKPQAASLLDISGRNVMDLHPGANDVRALAPGVYFVREEQAEAQAVRKVVLTE